MTKETTPHHSSESIDLTAHLGRFTFSNCLMNASGVYCFDADELNELNQSKAGAIVTKSATVEKRTGNPEPRYATLTHGSINSMGLPNLGIDYYIDFVLMAQLDDQAKEKDSKFRFISVSGLSPSENIDILQKIQGTPYQDFVELNLSCPNVIGEPQMGYNFSATRRLLEQVFSFYTKPLGVKLPPYFDLAHFDQMATILNEFPLAYVNVINSIGNGLAIDTETETAVIKPKNGFGGIGGDYVKHTALANVKGFYDRLDPTIKIIGTGGVESGEDVFQHLLCGASMVQIGTSLHEEGPEIFERIERELHDIMASKNYKTIDDFRGKLKSLM